jgi:hypothetical protein
VLALCFEGQGKLLACVLVIFKGNGFQNLKIFSITIGILNNPLHYRIKGVTYLCVYLGPHVLTEVKFQILEIKLIVRTPIKHRLGYKLWHK